MRFGWGVFSICVMIGVLTMPVLGQGQQPPAQAPPASTAPTTPQPLPNPSMTAPLQTAAPKKSMSAGLFGTVPVTEIWGGRGLTQSIWIPADKSTRWDLSNGQIF